MCDCIHAKVVAVLEMWEKQHLGFLVLVPFTRSYLGTLLPHLHLSRKNLGAEIIHCTRYFCLAKVISSFQ